MFFKQILKRLCARIYALAEQYHREQQREHFRFHPSVSFHKVSFEGNIHIGKNTYINEFSRIDSGKNTTIEIGSHCAIGRHVHITSKTHDLTCPTTDEDHAELKEKEANVSIGNYVWIGDMALILPGVVIGDYAIIAAHAVVANDVKPFEVVGGLPARHIRYNTQHYRYASYASSGDIHS